MWIFYVNIYNISYVVLKIPCYVSKALRKDFFRIIKDAAGIIQTYDNGQDM